MSYHPYTFWQFVLKSRPPINFGWIYNMGLLIMIGLVIYLERDEPFHVMAVGIAFFVVGGTLQKLFMYNILYQQYRAGGKAYHQLNGKKLVLHDLEVTVLGFDLFSKKKYFNFSVSIYDFEKADIILSMDSFVLNGIGRSGKNVYALPIEVYKRNTSTDLGKAKIKAWSADKDKVRITIEDESYKQPITLVLKSEVKRFTAWLKIDDQTR
ncbi:MAG: hypothetical protein NXI20_00260 [bacterium]|nr:hypothetical protein [bacterium]